MQFAISLARKKYSSASFTSPRLRLASPALMTTPTSSGNLRRFSSICLNASSLRPASASTQPTSLRKFSGWEEISENHLPVFTASSTRSERGKLENPLKQKAFQVVGVCFHLLEQLSVRGAVLF